MYVVVGSITRIRVRLLLVVNPEVGAGTWRVLMMIKGGASPGNRMGDGALVTARLGNLG